MSKYSFDRIEPKKFEAMAQALLEKKYRGDGNLIQFGDGQDGAREATWTQPITHPSYVRPENETEDVPKEWVFQVKYHDISLRGWTTARDAVIQDLNKELDKIVNKYKVPCHAYVMITNVPFTGIRNVGTRDQTTAIAAQWKKNIPEIYVWDAANLSCMLDADEDVRTAYLDDVLPGDVLKAIYTKINFRNDRKKSAFNAYLTYVIECEKSARAQEAGDAQDLPLSEVFIDFTLELAKISQKSDFGDEFSKVTWDIVRSIDSDVTFSPTNWSRVRASNALFIIESDFVLLLGGPGLGKSTLTQFLSLYQAARLIKPDLAQSLTQRLKLPQSISPKNLDAYVCLRFPFRIELRRYAKWMSERDVNNTDGHLSHYIVEVLINPNVDANLENDDIFGLAATDPILLVLDGLDEVPNRDTRQKIIENLKIFVNRIQAEKGNLQVILSSRPNGYSGEFDEFKPLIWEVNELEKADFDEYCEQWLKQRIPSLEERREAKEKIEVGMLSESVQRLAKSLLQATVILTIVKSKVQIPHQKHSLYKKYVDVIFEREKEKTPIIRKWENELLQLHQRVGFELHQKMEQSKIETLNRDEEFRKYIYDVLEDCSTGSRTLGEIVQEIVDIATDRLCLLVGKGENQTEIDFVVQQYREYFAASYLTNHPDAEPEKVFSMLINRGAYWSYVLQFYFAQATSNQQLRWLNDIESIDETIERTKACRAIMNTLPEINDSLKLKHFEQALKIIFYTETRWTWMVENSVIDVLKNTRSGSALQVIRKWLDNLSIGDQQTLEAELWLLGEIFSLEQKEEQLTLFENKVQELLQNENTRDNALISALENDLKIDLSTSNILEIKPTLSKFYYESILHINKKPESLNNFIQSQNITKLCELMFCFPLWEFTQTPLPFFTQQELLSIFGSHDRDNLLIFERHTKLLLEYYLVQKDLNIEQPLSEYEVDTQNEYFIHLKDIFDVVLDSSNYELDKKARNSEKRIPDPKLWGWRIDNILGPDLSAFNSIEDWKFFKKEIFNISTHDQDWIANSADFNLISNLWSVLFFHPRHWPLLVTESLITDDEYQTLVESKLANLLNIPKIPINLFRVRNLSDNKPVIPLLKILNVAITIAIQDGVEYLGKAEGLYSILWRCQIESVTSKDVNKLLIKSKNLNSLPSVWAGAIFYLCMNSPSLNLDLFIEFWEINQDTMIHRIPDFDQTLKKSDFLEEILAKKQKNTLKLAAVLIREGIKIDQSTQDKLYDQLLNGFKNNNFNTENDQMILYSALFELTPKIEEFSVWHCQKIIDEIAKSVFSLRELCQRFLSLSNPNNPGFVLEYKSLREALMVFITNRKNYPSALVLSALETILKIDEANLPPLQEQDWQRSDD